MAYLYAANPQNYSIGKLEIFKETEKSLYFKRPFRLYNDDTTYYDEFRVSKKKMCLGNLHFFYTFEKAKEFLLEELDRDIFKAENQIKIDKTRIEIVKNLKESKQ